jgi:hypothetical protein
MKEMRCGNSNRFLLSKRFQKEKVEFYCQYLDAQCVGGYYETYYEEQKLRTLKFYLVVSESVRGAERFSPGEMRFWKWQNHTVWESVLPQIVNK